MFEDADGQRDRRGQQAGDRDEEQVSQRLVPSREAANERHGDAAEDKGIRAGGEFPGLKRDEANGKREEQVDDAERDGRDVAEAQESPPPGVVAAEPLVAIEAEAHQHTGKEAEGDG